MMFTFENGIFLVAGTGFGFFISVFVVDKYYKGLMKMTIDEIHKNYLEVIERLKKRDV